MRGQRYRLRKQEGSAQRRVSCRLNKHDQQLVLQRNRAGPYRKKDPVCLTMLSSAGAVKKAVHMELWGRAPGQQLNGASSSTLAV